MKVIRGLYNYPKSLKTVATIGNFDGMHAGHQAVIERTLKKAKALNLPAMLILFEPQPLEFFLKDKVPPARLTRFREKLNYLETTDIDYVLVLNFNQQLASMLAEDFVKACFVNKVQHLIVGDDFRFGANRQGNFELLSKMGADHGFAVEDTKSFLIEGERVSSTMVRDALARGDMQYAETLLNRHYTLSGRVRHGHKRGRTIDFPTANIYLHRAQSPVLGVFAVQMRGIDDQPMNGVANVGSRPTVDGTRILLEVFLFDFDRDIYGQQVEVDLLHKLRDEKRYDSFDLLKEQIQKDVENAKAYFSQ